MARRSERLRQTFQAEARERLSELTAGALQVERGECPPELPGALFRGAHTIKGGARMLGLDDAAAAAERLETLLGDLRDGRAAPSPSLGAALLAAVDALREAIWPTEPGGEDATGAAGGWPAAGPGPPGGEGRGASLRVAAERVDAVVALVAEARRVAGGIAAGGGAAHAVGDVLAAAEEAALRLRLVPLSGLFGDLERAVRDAARDDGKLAELAASGGEVEADAAVVDAAAEIVLQLVRNAVAHGIEPPGLRQSLGKAPLGRVSVQVRARGGWLELVVADDGRGVDVAALARRAAERGLRPDASAEELLFAPGLSTRARADSLGGQGVGLDVVRARVAAAGGDVSVAWEVDRGTRFTVRLPVAALYERLLAGPLGRTLIGLPADAVAAVGAPRPVPGPVGPGSPNRAWAAPASASGADGPAPGPAAGAIGLDGLPEEVSVLTVPLGPLFGPCRLVRRAWIGPDGRVGVVVEAEALL
ncbi:MAG TPA: ATP-binding protein [Chloroflexota bacterium]